MSNASTHKPRFYLCAPLLPMETVFDAHDAVAAADDCGGDDDVEDDADG